MTRLDIATSVTTLTLVTDQTVLVNQAIDIALRRVYEWFDWPFYMQNGVVQTKATYSTGTAKVTNGSTSVVGVGTSFSSDMVGRKFRHANENAYYRIASVGGATSLTLQDAYQGTTDSTGSSFTIYKDEYRLSPDVNKYKTMIQIQNGVPLFDYPPTQFDLLFPTPQSYSDPIMQMNTGSRLDTYSTGTVSATAQSNTITGSGTSWDTVEGLGRMSFIRIGSNVYTVKSVDSATQITTYEQIVTSAAALTTYVVTLDNLIVQFYNIPNIQENIYYRYFRMAAQLANDYDVPDMPKDWHWLLIYGAAAMVYLQKGDINKSQEYCEVRFTDGLSMMKQKIGSFAADRIYKKKSMDRISRIGDGLEKSTFDRRYSSP